MGRLRLIAGGTGLLVLAGGMLATSGCCGLGDALGRLFVLMIFETHHLSSPWSPEGDRVLIGGGLSALASVDVASGETIELAGLGVVSASFSPDGRSILCSGVLAHGKGLWIESADGGERTLLAEARGESDMASAFGTWSPDGQWIALSGFLELVRPDLSERRSLFTEGGVWLPAWSPDGRWIACTGVEEGPGGHSLQVVAVDGGERRRIGKGAFASWSPDGRRLAYVDFTEDGVPGGVRVVDASGENSRFLCEGGNPRWSPCADEILVQRYENVRGRLYLVATDGSSERLLTLGNTAWWSPDGSLVSFYRENELFLVNADGSGERSLGRAPSGSFPED
jgi:dipeptidyl aminopeptidase/acylaminoacyl peptidase